jgi:xylan 1,4-beta-xylosidase
MKKIIKSIGLAALLLGGVQIQVPRRRRPMRRISRSARVILATLAVLGFLGAAREACAQAPVDIEVDAAVRQGPVQPFWRFFGYDEPNYTYTENGRKLLRELAALSPGPVYIRTHNLLTSGDGTGALKWGSTNAYTEDAQGKPIYDWKILDRIFDAYRDAGVRPLVQVGFMPEALSSHPAPYRHNFPNGPLTTGWAYPPKDWTKWSDLIAAWAAHAKARYGEAAVRTWLWEVWNEPDGTNWGGRNQVDSTSVYWRGTPAEFDRLYDLAAAAIRRAIPDAQIGGPHVRGCCRAAAPPQPELGPSPFLTDFLARCAEQRSATTADPACGLDYVGMHVKGVTQFVDGHIRMGVGVQLAAARQEMEVVRSFPQWRGKPVIFGESDPEGCAACTPRTNPEEGYRDDALYAAYVIETTHGIGEVAAHEGLTVRGAVTWAFQFENLPTFSGMRDLATNGIDKPVLNAFRALGLLVGDRVAAHSSGALDAMQVAGQGVRDAPDINVMAARTDRQVTALVWNYHDDDVASPDAHVRLNVRGLPAGGRVLVEHFRIDHSHSNAYTAWRAMGSPANPSPAQRGLLEQAGQLQMLTSPEWVRTGTGAVQMAFALPRYGVSLVRFTW